VSGSAKREESIAASGARWMTVAFMMVGLLNYGYALTLTRFLDVAAYSRFAAGQGLILWASMVATVSVPLPLAQSLARAQSEEERGAAIRFSKLSGAGSGIIVAAVVGLIATQLGGSVTALVVALSAFALFLGTTTTGWLQGQQRMRMLSALYVGENVVKNLAGLLLVIIVGLRDNGALAAFGIGSIVMLVWWPRAPRSAGRPWLAALTSRSLWRRTLRIAAAQGMVSLFVAFDVVLVALLPGDRALVASYQVSAALSRVALFIAGAIAAAFFPSLSRQRTGGMIAARALRMYAAIALPLSIVLATMPPALLAIMFPAQYGAMATLLKFTAVTGFATGGTTLMTAFFQAADDSSCLPWLGVGLAGYVLALLVGWRIGGISGLAIGAAVGALATLILMGYRLVRREGRRVLARIPLAESAAAAAVLVLLRPYAVPWLAVATLVGLYAGVRFMGYGERHTRPPRRPRANKKRTDGEPAVSLLIDTVWRGTARKANDAELYQALALARQNRIEGRLARAYPVQLSGILGEARVTAELFAHNLDQVGSCLHRAGIATVLVKADLPGDRVDTDIDLVVHEQHWNRAFTALADWYVDSSTYQLEHSTMAILCPSTGPKLHLYTSASWFGVPVFPTRRLLARARKGQGGFLVPAPADYLRIWLAQALFQNLTLDLSRLLAVRNLLNPTVIMAARSEAIREGWRSDFDDALTAACRAIASLDQGFSVNLPVPIPVSHSVGIGRVIVPGDRKEASALRAPDGVPQLVDQQTAVRVLPAITKNTKDGD
jgi:O-antigen/teichoic acid export membrane protein